MFQVKVFTPLCFVLVTCHAEGLVNIGKELAQQLQVSVKPGQKLCSKCKKRALDESNLEPQLGGNACTEPKLSDDSSAYEPEREAGDDLNRTLDSLDLSPFKTSVSKRDKLSHAKKKLRQAHTEVKKKVARGMKLNEQDLEETDVDEDSCQGCKDLDRFVSLLKEKVRDVGTRHEKIKLLTLAPHSWSVNKMSKEFGVKRNLAWQAQQLKKTKGILADPTPKKGRSLPQDTKEKVTAFYESNEFSRMCPGKKECVAIRDENGKKVYRQKQLLLVNLKELHVAFKEKHPQNPVGFSKFCQLRPKWCIPVTAAGTHSVCVCQQHQNAKLVVAALPEKNIDYKMLLSKIVCNLENRDCMIHLCDKCPGKDALHEYLADLFDSYDFDLDESICCKQWGQTDRSNLVSLTVSIEEFICTATDMFDSLRQHHFTAKAQSGYISSLKESLSQEEAIVLLDFAENYSFIVQDAVQGYHWNNSQATLHPLVVYFRTEEELQFLNFCIISDCLKHDTTTVHAFISKLIPELRKKLPLIKKLIYFSDGAASQYKNYKNFTNLCHHNHDHGLDAEWNFFATSHGKSPCDGIGGTVKRLVARASLQATTQGHILTPGDMHEWACDNIPGVTFFYVSAEEVSANAAKVDLESRFAQASTLSGTRSHHCFVPTSETELNMKRLSADSHYTVASISTQSPRAEIISFKQLPPGKYVACVYDREWYVGCIVECSEQHGDVMVNFMKRSTSGLFYWPPPSKKDECWVPLQHIICLISAPELQGHIARFYKLDPKDARTIEQNLPAFL